MKTNRSGFMRVMAAGLAVVLVLIAMAGCSKKTDKGEAAESKYETAKDLFDEVWNNTKKDLPVIGGSVENPSDNEPGSVDPKDKETLSAMFLVPEDVIEHVTDAATLLHMMNANTFTGAALKLDDISVDEAAGKIKDAFKSNQFMCGIPEKIIIYSVGPDIIYFFGAEEILDEFEAAAAKIDGAKMLVEEYY